MPNPLEWMFRMQDMLSGPSARMERQLKSLNLALRSLSISARAARVGPLADGMKYQTALLRTQRDQVLLSKKAMESTGGVVHSLAEKITDNRKAMRDWLLILDPVARGLRWISSEAQVMGRRIADAVTTRQEGLLGLQSAFGARGAGVQGQLQKMSLRTGRPMEQLQDQVARFGALGISPSRSMAAALAISDAKVRKLDAGRLEATLTSIASRPVLDMREIKGGFTGVMDENLFWKNLAKTLHVSVGDANQLVERNLVPGKNFGFDMALKPFQDTQGGRLGIPTIKRADTTLQGRLDKLNESTNKLFAGVEKTPGFRAFNQVLDNLLKVIGTPATQKLVNDLANNLGEMLRPLTGPEGRKNMQEFFTSMKSGIELALPGVKSLVEGLGFLAKWGIVKPVQGLGMLSGGGAVRGMTLDEITGGNAGADADQQRRNLIMSLPGSRAGDSYNYGLRGAESPVFGPMKPNVTVHAPIKVIINGNASAADAHEIAKQVSDQVPTHIADAIEQMANEQGAQ